MANKEKGEVSLDIGDTTYTMVVDMDAMCSLESMFSTPDREVTYQEISDRINAGSMRHIRAFVWAALKKHHPDIKLTDISPLIQKAGGVEAFTLILLTRMAEAAGATVPDKADLEALGFTPDALNPQTAQTSGTAGTGKGSRSKRVA